MESNRQKKVARLVQKDLSQIFLQDSRVHYSSVMVSVTHVLITKDLSQAKVYLSLFPKRLDVFEEITLRRLKIKHQLSCKLKNQLRKTPDLFFYIDNSQEHYDNISSLLKDI